MINIYRKENHGRSDLGWLDSHFYFSFAEYHNEKRMHFGNLRVINDDLISPHTGFDTHPHRDMEIISYVIDGGLSHADSMGHEKTLYRGEVQYMSAGTGLTHSEYNHDDEILRLLQIWIFPDAKGYKPDYGDNRFVWSSRVNKWLHMVSSKNGNAPISINQDSNIFVTYLEKRRKLNFNVDKGRQAYFIQIEGESLVNDIQLNERDGAEIIEEKITVKSLQDSHIMIIEMKK